MTALPRFNPRGPKVSLRRFTDPGIRCEIKSFAMNRKTEAEPKALEYIDARLAQFEALYSGSPVLVE